MMMDMLCGIKQLVITMQTCYIHQCEIQGDLNGLIGPHEK
jgi:hypothetical protein